MHLYLNKGVVDILFLLLFWFIMQTLHKYILSVTEMAVVYLGNSVYCTIYVV